jgi:hypothetical protein
VTGKELRDPRRCFLVVWVHCYKFVKTQKLSKITLTDWVPVTHACNPSYLRGWDWEIEAQGQPEETVLETSSQPIAGHSGA